MVFCERFVKVGIDPSFARTGVSILVQDGHRVLLVNNFHVDIPEKTFEGLFKAAVEQSKHVCSYLQDNIGKFFGGEPSQVSIFMETPPPFGQFAAGLWLLDGLLLYGLARRNWHVYTFGPQKIKSLLGSRKATKSDAVKLAEDIVSGQTLDKVIVRDEDVTEYFVKNRKIRINHDEAESFIGMSYVAQLNVPSYPIIKDKWFFSTKE